MKIKVCGITQREQLEQLSELDIDYAGLIFYAPSKRSMIGKLSPEDVRFAGGGIRKTGVFVNASASEVLERVEEYQLDLVQLHGDETVATCNQICHYVKVVKAFRMGGEVKDIDRMVSSYFDCCDYYLFDNASLGIFGGTGEKFNWASFEKAAIHKPFFLSGGLAPEDATVVKGFAHPFFHAIDINSRFEIEPGIKNMPAIRQFVQEIRSNHEECFG